MACLAGPAFHEGRESAVCANVASTARTPKIAMQIVARMNFG
jgi:hypothetical protein